MPTRRDPTRIKVEIDRDLYRRLCQQELVDATREKRSPIPFSRLVDLKIAEALSPTGFAAVLIKG